MTLNEFYDTWLTDGGVFADLSTHDPPWESENSYSYGVQYHGNHSGQKTISPLLNTLIGDESARDKISSVICAMYMPNWGKLWATMELEYNPIENYSMTEAMTNDITTDQYGKTTTRTDNLTHSKTGTDTRTDNLTDTNTPNVTTNTDNTTYGFNSSNPVPTNEIEQRATGTDTTTHTGTEQRQYNLSDTDTGTQGTTDSGTDTHTRNYTLTRAGNIGVTTSQQMIESERALWIWNFFETVVFPDLDRVLTLQIY